MKIIQREDIDIEKWEDLVNRDPSQNPFSRTHYLDAVAENWCVYVDDNYTKGIALPFIIRFGFKSLYTPIFVRYLEWFGEKDSAFDSALKEIQSHFDIGDWNVKEPFDSCFSNTFVYQRIDPGLTDNQRPHAKRMLNKVKRLNYSISIGNNTSLVHDSIQRELPQKIAAFQPKSLAVLRKLVNAIASTDTLLIVEARKEKEFVGGLFLVESGSKLLYLKGAFTADSKKEGAMYAAMQYAIEIGKNTNRTFDFGGSRVEGVRRFNLALGGSDIPYVQYEWNRAPIWFNWIKKVKNKWKKK